MNFDCGFTKENNWFRYRVGAIIIEDGCMLFARNEVDDYYYSVGGGVHMNEKAEDAVCREVLEETGIPYEIDRLAVIHENFFDGEGNVFLSGLNCHEISFYYLMKSRGMKELNSNSYTNGVKEHVDWIPIDEIGKYKLFPTFLKEDFNIFDNGIVHIVTDERK